MGSNWVVLKLGLLPRSWSSSSATSTAAKKLSAAAGLEWRPNEHLFLGLGYEYNDIELSHGHFVARLIQVEANYAFDVRWSWVNLIQYDNESESAGINSRLRWNPRAGRDLYVVLNHGFDAERAFSRLRSTDSRLSIKYTQTFRF